MSTVLTPVFTLGYQLRSIEEYLEELQEAGIDLVVDVRENPLSRKRGFSKSKLEERLAEVGIEYLHLEYVGNPARIRKADKPHAACLVDYAEHISEDPEILQRFAAHLKKWTESGKRICLLCYERHPDDCHRSILLDQTLEILSEPVAVEHLGPEGAPRFA